MDVEAIVLSLQNLSSGLKKLEKLVGGRNANRPVTKVKTGNEPCALVSLWYSEEFYELHRWPRGFDPL